MLSKDDVLRGLQTETVGRKLFVFESLDSTNTCAKTLAEAGAVEGTVVVSEFQTNGKGRLGRQWKAEPGCNLLFSAILRPSITGEVAGLLTFFAAISVAKAIERATHSSVECKWPNDLLMNGKKVCGILLENSLEQHSLAYSVIGIGLNVNQKSWNSELDASVTSLALETGAMVDRGNLLRIILQEMDSLYGGVQESRFDIILAEWNKRCFMLGKGVTIVQDHVAVSGTAIGLSPEGGLIVKTPEGPRTIHAGEVTIPPSR